MPADIPCMPNYGRHFEPGQLQFITTSAYRRSRLFTCQRFCWTFVETLRQLRQETGFLLIGRLAQNSSSAMHVHPRRFALLGAMYLLTFSRRKSASRNAMTCSTTRPRENW
jgi:hypothetical protein